MPLEPSLQYESVAPVSVYIHITWVELKKIDGFVTIVGHRITSTVVCFANMRRMASIAVYVQ